MFRTVDQAQVLASVQKAVEDLLASVISILFVGGAGVGVAVIEPSGLLAAPILIGVLWALNPDAFTIDRWDLAIAFAGIYLFGGGIGMAIHVEAASYTPVQLGVSGGDLAMGGAVLLLVGALLESVQRLRGETDG